MPLRCLDENGHSIHSFDLMDDEWRQLVVRNRERRSLRMPCCGSPVTLKHSPRGRPFFAHKAIGSCTTAPETEAHLHLKAMAVAAARANGWIAQSEVAGVAPSGERWTADVLAWKGKQKSAVEVQWSGQADDETECRQERYKASGVRCLWLLRRPGFPIAEALPAACVGGSLDGGFQALIPYHPNMTVRDRVVLGHWHQVLPMEQFLSSAFSGRFRYGVPPNVEATASVWAAEMMCWSCGAETGVVTRVEIRFGPNEFGFSLAELGEHPDLAHEVLGSLPSNDAIGEIRRRASKALRESHLSNGCAHCDALMGDHYAVRAHADSRELWRFAMRMTDRWKQAIEASPYYNPVWSAYPPTEGGPPTSAD